VLTIAFVVLLVLFLSKVGEAAVAPKEELVRPVDE
jgi:hypothetical protein